MGGRRHHAMLQLDIRNFARGKQQSAAVARASPLDIIRAPRMQAKSAQEEDDEELQRVLKLSAMEAERQKRQIAEFWSGANVQQNVPAERQHDHQEHDDEAATPRDPLRSISTNSTQDKSSKSSRKSHRPPRPRVDLSSSPLELRKPRHSWPKGSDGTAIRPDSSNRKDAAKPRTENISGSARTYLSSPFSGRNINIYPNHYHVAESRRFASVGRSNMVTATSMDLNDSLDSREFAAQLPETVPIIDTFDASALMDLQGSPSWSERGAHLLSPAHNNVLVQETCPSPYSPLVRESTPSCGYIASSQSTVAEDLGGSTPRQSQRKLHRLAMESPSIKVGVTASSVVNPGSGTKWYPNLHSKESRSVDRIVDASSPEVIRLKYASKLQDEVMPGNRRRREQGNQASPDTLVKSSPMPPLLDRINLKRGLGSASRKNAKASSTLGKDGVHDAIEELAYIPRQNDVILDCSSPSPAVKTTRMSLGGRPVTSLSQSSDVVITGVCSSNRKSDGAVWSKLGRYDNRPSGPQTVYLVDDESTDEEGADHLVQETHEPDEDSPWRNHQEIEGAGDSSDLSALEDFVDLRELKKTGKLGHLEGYFKQFSTAPKAGRGSTGGGAQKSASQYSRVNKKSFKRGFAFRRRKKK